jgi:hypothetical protein
VLFEAARPQAVVLTTPNAEYNVKFETLPAGQFRHKDHRFEWTRAAFQKWSQGVATRFGYRYRQKAKVFHVERFANMKILPPLLRTTL